MHPNTFGGLEPPGPAGGAYVLPRPLDLLGEGGKGRGPTLKRDERREERRKGWKRGKGNSRKVKVSIINSAYRHTVGGVA